MIHYLEEWETFKQLPLEEKRGIALRVIEQFRWKWETFDIIYDYLNNWGDNITDQDCIDVYQSLMKTSYTIENEEKVQSMERLKVIKEKWLQMRKKELSEKNNNQQDAIEMLNSL